MPAALEDDALGLLLQARSLLIRSAASAEAILHLDQCISCVSVDAPEENAPLPASKSHQETQTNNSSRTCATQANPAVATASTATGASTTALGPRNGVLQENR